MSLCVICDEEVEGTKLAHKKCWNSDLSDKIPTLDQKVIKRFQEEDLTDEALETLHEDDCE